MSEAVTAPKTRDFGIDVLRGLAILFVVLLHLNIRVPFHETPLGAAIPKRLYSLIFWSGYYGVATFFVISGYLITSSSLRRWGALSAVDVKAFYWMRFARIAPLLVGLVLSLAALHFAEVPGFVIDENQTSLARASFAALTFHMNWLQVQVGYLPASWDVLWSLSIEESFYLFFPLFCLFVRARWQLVLLLSVLAVLSPWARVALYPGNELGDRNHFAYLDALTVGCLAAVLARNFELSERLRRLLTILAGLVLAFVFYFRSELFQLGLTKVGLNITLLAFGAGLFLWAHHRPQRAQRSKAVFGLKWLSELGRHSYEIYLSHMFVLLACVALFNREPGPHHPAAIYTLYLASLFLSYFVGKAIARWFTEPLNQWLRRLGPSVSS